MNDLITETAMSRLPQPTCCKPPLELQHLPDQLQDAQKFHDPCVIYASLHYEQRKSRGNCLCSNFGCNILDSLFVVA
jgi:hypothetical protein